MKHIKSILLASLFCLFAEMSFAQVYAEFEYRNGQQYAVLTNYGSNTVYVTWRCVNYYLGQWRDGSVTLQPGYETCVGPNVGWYWQYGETFVYQVAGNQYNISFGATSGSTTPPNNNSDGYIYQGGETVRYDGHTYPLYKKNGHYYIYDRNEGWIRIKK